MILDAGFLISVDRGERSAQVFLHGAVQRGRVLHTTEPVVAQVWRNGSRQARLARFLSTVTIHPMTDGRAVGAILARSATSDVIDAHLLTIAIEVGQPILTGDLLDLQVLVEAAPNPRPRIHHWPSVDP